MTLTTLALATLGVAPALAQAPTEDEIDDYIELARMDIRQGRADLMGQNMALSASQAATFWPIYEAYEEASAALGDEQLQIIRDYAQRFDAMDDDAASELAGRALDLDERKQALLREYHGKVESALGGSLGARFMQVEHRIQTLLDLQLAAEIPLLEAP